MLRLLILRWAVIVVVLMDARDVLILAMVLARGDVMLVVSKEIVHTFVLEVAKALVVVAVAVTIIKVINFNF